VRNFRIKQILKKSSPEGIDSFDDGTIILENILL
jgi:hypothetical protein